MSIDCTTAHAFKYASIRYNSSVVFLQNIIIERIIFRNYWHQKCDIHIIIIIHKDSFFVSSFCKNNFDWDHAEKILFLIMYFFVLPIIQYSFKLPSNATNKFALDTQLFEMSRMWGYVDSLFVAFCHRIWSMHCYSYSYIHSTHRLTDCLYAYLVLYWMLLWCLHIFTKRLKDHGDKFHKRLVGIH